MTISVDILTYFWEKKSYHTNTYFYLYYSRTILLINYMFVAVASVKKANQPKQPRKSHSPAIDKSFSSRNTHSNVILYFIFPILKIFGGIYCFPLKVLNLGYKILSPQKLPTKGLLWNDNKRVAFVCNKYLLILIIKTKWKD